MNDESYRPLRVKDLAVQDRPQERLEKLGPGALSDTELLAMLLRSGSKGHNVISIAQRLIAEAGSLTALVKWHEADFRRLTGIGRVKALQLVTVMEIVRRGLAQGAETEDEILNRPALIHAHFQSQIAGLAVEKFWVLCLNRKNRLLKQVEITSGTATSSLAHPREVFREAIRQGATAIVCVHNHPSGDPAPSAADVQVTRLWEASHNLVYANCRIMGTGLSGRRRVSTGTSHDDGVGSSHNYSAPRKASRWECALGDRLAAGNRSRVFRHCCFILRSAST